MRIIFVFCFISWSNILLAQPQQRSLNEGWSYASQAAMQWNSAKVPGSVYTDLINDKTIEHPFFGKNEVKSRWVDSTTWIYQKTFSASETQFANTNNLLVFEGLDTYADVYFNDVLLLQANNMFRSWTIKLPKILPANNVLKIVFHPAIQVNDSLAKQRYNFFLPSDNRIHGRKAAYQFGWDWGPTLVNCGIWKAVYLQGLEDQPMVKAAKPLAQLITKKDKEGERFYFQKAGKEIYIKGANWIPASTFPSSVTKEEYRKLLIRAKEANMNMLRVWGGGIYESDYFYDLCDSLGIMVWQDFMFAGGMYPGSKDFLENVREEVKQQIERLKKHPSIVLWCGNNEIEEGWKHWGWQNQFNLHGKDSAEVWAAYKTLFQDSLPAWVNRWDGHREYISTSPRYGWGNEKSYVEGDSHYWGLWWGLEPWEVWENKTGRFVSEYGMQAASSEGLMKNWLPLQDSSFNSESFQWHQKANEGNLKLHHYINQYLLDSARLSLLSRAEYIYVTQCLQHYILTNSIASHMAKRPHNMGTLLWQLNDSWPAVSWSILNVDATPKAAYYAVKAAYKSNKAKYTTVIYPKNWKPLNPQLSIERKRNGILKIRATQDAYYVRLFSGSTDVNVTDNYFSLKKEEVKELKLAEEDWGKEIEIVSWYDIVSKYR